MQGNEQQLVAAGRFKPAAPLAIGEVEVREGWTKGEMPGYQNSLGGL